MMNHFSAMCHGIRCHALWNRLNRSSCGQWPSCRQIGLRNDTLGTRADLISSDARRKSSRFILKPWLWFLNDMCAHMKMMLDFIPTLLSTINNFTYIGVATGESRGLGLPGPPFSDWIGCRICTEPLGNFSTGVVVGRMIGTDFLVIIL